MRLLASEPSADPFEVTRRLGVTRDLLARRALRPAIALAGIDEGAPLVARLARLDLPAGAQDASDAAAIVPVPGGSVELLPAPGVDPEEQERRLAARRAELEGEIRRAEGKLANAGFVAKAPPELVEAERGKLEQLRVELAAI